MRLAANRSWQLVLQYLLLAVLFLRTIWGIWAARDITFGDTSFYYVIARKFAEGLTCSIAWSPLYTSFMGAFHWLNADPYFVVIAHRVVILAIVTVLIFEIARRLLAAPLAWLVTAWWLLLPIDHAALYEVHLFALIPVLVFWLLLSWGQSLRVRGACVGVLILATVLMRNELLIALGAFAAMSVAWDVWQRQREGRRCSPLHYLAAYGVPVILALAVILVAYWRSTVKYPELSAVMKDKHVVNVGQIYAFGYGQRHPDYTADPWNNYQPLMASTFGKSEPGMREALAANPRAMFDHFLWNVSLIPSGLQVALFNCRSGPINPDYPPTSRNPALATPLSLAYLALVLVAAIFFVRNRHYWWENGIRPRIWMILGMACVVLTVGVVMVMQRPRPSYMFSQTIVLMLLAGAALGIVLHHLRLQRPATILGWASAILLAFLVPSYYGHAAGQSGRKAVSRPLLDMLRMIQPYRSELLSPDLVIGTPGFGSELRNYLGLAKDENRRLLLNMETVLQRMPAQASFAQTLARRHARLVIVADWQTGDARVKQFMDEAKAGGWKLEKKAPQFRLYSAPAAAK